MFLIKSGFWKESIKKSKNDLDLDFAIKSSNIVSIESNFSGQFSLYNPSGTYWQEFTQTSDLNLSEGPNSRIGGIDQINIIANGDDINIPIEWVNIGNDVIGTSNGDINRIMIVKTAMEIQYIVKVY